MQTFQHRLKQWRSVHACSSASDLVNNLIAHLKNVRVFRPSNQVGEGAAYRSWMSFGKAEPFRTERRQAAQSELKCFLN